MIILLLFIIVVSFFSYDINSNLILVTLLFGNLKCSSKSVYVVSLSDITLTPHNSS